MNATDKPKRALIVLDILENFIISGSSKSKLLSYIDGELNYFRERGRTVIFANMANFNLEKTSTWQIAPRANETVIHKPAASAFFETTLEDTLQKNSIGRISLVGIETHTSVLSTAEDAFARNYEVAVPETCVWSQNPKDHRTALNQIRASQKAWTANDATLQP